MARLAEDLEAITNAEDQAAFGGKTRHRLHDRGKAGDRARAQIVAVGKATGENETINRWDLGGRMPHVFDRNVEHTIEHVVGVRVTVCPRKNDDAETQKIAPHPFVCSLYHNRSK